MVFLAGCVAVALCALRSTAYAFSEPSIYGDPPAEGGGGGRWFTGSPADGYGCGTCHTGQGSLPVYQTGLPIDGYVPGDSYTVKLSWPEAAQRAAQAQALGLRPSMSLVAEFVAEDGSPSGRVQIQPQFAMPAELCTNTPDGSPLLAATMFRPPPGGEGEPVEGNDCDASEKGDRCIVAVRACGSSALRVFWTAPSQWRGPIWFSAGFVMTDDASGKPNDNDYVTELVIPMNAAAQGGKYETKLHAGCSVLRVSAASPRWLLCGFILGGLPWCIRRRRPRARHAALNPSRSK